MNTILFSKRSDESNIGIISKAFLLNEVKRGLLHKLSVGPKPFLQSRPVFGQCGTSAMRWIISELANILSSISPGERPVSAHDATVESALFEIRISNPLPLIFFPTKNIFIDKVKYSLAFVRVVCELSNVFSAIDPKISSGAVGNVVHKFAWNEFDKRLVRPVFQIQKHNLSGRNVTLGKYPSITKSLECRT